MMRTFLNLTNFRGVNLGFSLEQDELWKRKNIQKQISLGLLLQILSSQFEDSFIDGIFSKGKIDVGIIFIFVFL